MSETSFFQILGIEPTVDRKEIKRAYHQKLPLFHPEEDSYGFRTLRAAFESAIEYAESAREYTEDPRHIPKPMRPAAMTETIKGEREDPLNFSLDSMSGAFDVDGIRTLQNIYRQGIFSSDFSEDMLRSLNARYHWNEQPVYIQAEFGEAFYESLFIRITLEQYQDPDICIRLIEKFYAQNDLYEAINILTISREKFPSDSTLQFLAVRIYYELGHYEQVLECIAQIDDPPNSQLDVYSAAAELCLYGINEERLSKLEQVAVKADDGIIGYELLKNIYWENQQYKKMLVFAKLLARVTPSPYNISCRGVALAGANKMRSAKKDFAYVYTQLRDKEREGTLDATEASALAYVYYHAGFWKLGNFWGLMTGEKKDLHAAMENAVFGIRVSHSFRSLYELVLEICELNKEMRIPDEVCENAINHLAYGNPVLAKKIIDLHTMQKQK